MYQIVWFRQRCEITRESSGLKEPDDVVRFARAKALMPTIAAMIGGTPAEFHIVDQTGYPVAKQQLIGGLPSA
jgi:hypothetical protein